MKLDYNAAKSAGYSDQEINDFAKAKKVELLNAPKKEGLKTFAKSAFEATGIPKFAKTTGATIDTLGSMATMKINPELSSKLADRALKAREETGTTGSITTPWGGEGQGSAAKTAWNVGEAAARTGLTAYGASKGFLPILKTAAVTTPVGGVISKMTGGTFSEGAGAGFGSAPATVATTDILSVLTGKSKYIQNIKSEKGIVGKIRQTLLPWENVSKTGANMSTSAARNAADINVAPIWKKAIDEAVASGDPAQLNAIKAFASLGKSSAQRKVIMNASAETLKKIAESSPPSAALDVLFSRRNYGKLADWSNFAQIMKSPSKAKAAKIMYSALNEPLKKIPGVVKGDQLVKNSKLVGKIIYGILGARAFKALFGSNTPAAEAAQTVIGVVK